MKSETIALGAMVHCCVIAVWAFVADLMFNNGYFYTAVASLFSALFFMILLARFVYVKENE